MKNPWKTLDILPTRDLGKIKAAYRVCAQRFHPDKARTSEEKKHHTLHFIEVQEAYARAKFMAQYALDLQPLHIRYPPDPCESAILGNDWLMAAVVIVAGSFGFWLIGVSSVNAVDMPPHKVHALLVGQATFVFAWIRRPGSGAGRAGIGAQRRGLQRFAAVASRLRAWVQK